MQGIIINQAVIFLNKPEEIGLTLDEYGFINVSNLIEGLNRKGYKVTISDLERIAAYRATESIISWDGN